MKDRAIQNALSTLSKDIVVGIDESQVAIAFNQTLHNQNTVVVLEMKDARLLQVLLTKTLTQPKPNDMPKIQHKMQLLAKTLANGLVDGSMTNLAIIQMLRKVTPLEAAYLSLSIASYLPDDWELRFRQDILRQVIS